MITKKDIRKAMKLLTNPSGYLCADSVHKQIACSLKVYESRGEFDGSYSSAVECLKQAKYEMENEKEHVKVVFRKFKDNGGIIALFPESLISLFTSYIPGKCISYMHVGQHSEADYSGCVYASKPATPEEYAPLKRELESIGYELEIIKRYRRKK